MSRSTQFIILGVVLTVAVALMCGGFGLMIGLFAADALTAGQVAGKFFSALAIHMVFNVLMLAGLCMVIVLRFKEKKTPIGKMLLIYGGLPFLITLFSSTASAALYATGANSTANLTIVGGYIFAIASLNLLKWVLVETELASENNRLQVPTLIFLVVVMIFDLGASGISGGGFTRTTELGGNMTHQKGVTLCVQGGECPKPGKAERYAVPLGLEVVVWETVYETVPTSNGGNQTQVVVPQSGQGGAAAAASAQVRPTSNSEAGKGLWGKLWMALIPGGSSFPFWVITWPIVALFLVNAGRMAYAGTFFDAGAWVGQFILALLLYVAGTVSIGFLFYGGDALTGFNFEEKGYERDLISHYQNSTLGKVPSGLDIEPWVVAVCGPREGGLVEVRVGHGAFEEKVIAPMRAGDVQVSPLAISGASHWMTIVKNDGYIREVAQGFASELRAANGGLGPCSYYTHANDAINTRLDCMIGSGGYSPGVDQRCGLVRN